MNPPAPPPKPRMRNLRVKELSERDRRRLARHFIDLDAGDRLLRFGSFVSDDVIAGYVRKIDFTRDKVFGVHNFKFRLVGVGHLAFAPREIVKFGSAATSKAKAAELGISVSRSARGMGVGTQLFARAVIHCRNADVDTLYMQCLSSNQTMMHLAKKAGMEIHREYGEADAYLKLPPADPASVLQEAMQEQVATLDYALKANVRGLFKWIKTLRGR